MASAAPSDGRLSPRKRNASFGDITDASPLMRFTDGAVKGSDDKVKQNRDKLWALMSSYLSNGAPALQ